jgi:hypothetical protein
LSVVEAFATRLDVIQRCCIVTLITSTPHESTHYRARLAQFGLAHRTVEVRRRNDGPHGPELAAAAR